jgi:hypothetical protein
VDRLKRLFKRDPEGDDPSALVGAPEEAAQSAA